MKDGIEILLEKPVRYLKGVGDARVQLFQRLGLYTVRDVLTHFPRDYEDRSKLKRIIELEEGEPCSFEGIIASRPTENRPRRGMLVTRAVIRDETGLITAVWFNQSYIKRLFNQGDRYVFYGRVTRRRTLEVLNPVFEKLDDRELLKTCRIIPVYPATGSLSQNVIRSAIRASLDLADGRLADILPGWIRSRFALSGINYSISNIHFPKSDEDFKNARHRLVFEELLLLQLGLLSIKNSIGAIEKGIRFGARKDVTHFLDKLPFRLTNAQSKVLEEIEADMEGERVMNRLIQGDVGSGKTVVAAAALLKAVKSGYQGAFMVPTEILAEQHFKTTSGLLEGFGVKIAVLKGGMPKKAREDVLEGIRNGSIDLVIGTHALLEENVVFERLGLVVTDEQHRFGVRQRMALSRKGENPDIIIMTATPIPRTLALILYGDMDISVIDELPPGRKPIQTFVVNEGMRERINKFIVKNVQEGRQVYIVCPLVEESDAVEAKSAAEHARHIAEVDFSDLRVGLIHGKMKPAEKDEVMKSFEKGDTDILVSTTVIEVGVNVPNASLMVVENSERFGLAQLHQLRGRVGRGEYQSYCILYNESRSEISQERMKVMEKTNDGFVISEKDLELRGPGDFFGTMQHGLPDLKIANLYKDIDILKQAQEAARELLDRDRLLQGEENRLLGENISKRFRVRTGTL